MAEEESPLKKVDDKNKEVPDLKVAGYTFFGEQSDPVQPEVVATHPVSVDPPVSNQSLAVPEVATALPVVPIPATPPAEETYDSQPEFKSDKSSASQFRGVRENPYAAEIERNHDVTRFDPMSTSEEKSRSGITVGFLAVVIAICLLIVILTNKRSVTTPPNTHGAGTAPSSNHASPDGAVDFGPYMSNLQRSIKRAWFPPKGNETKRVVVQFKVHKDGSIDKLRIVTTSGVQIADEAALDAVRHANFQALPEGAPDDVDIQFTFDYNVFKRR